MMGGRGLDRMRVVGVMKRSGLGFGEMLCPERGNFTTS